MFVREKDLLYQVHVYEEDKLKMRSYTECIMH